MCMSIFYASTVVAFTVLLPLLQLLRPSERHANPSAVRCGPLTPLVPRGNVTAERQEICRPACTSAASALCNLPTEELAKIVTQIERAAEDGHRPVLYGEQEKRALMRALPTFEGTS